ncbi:integrase family protein [Deinococcus aerius]|uniref:Integrase family protein n=1 Tax=Deinococcus aerius TaxID=200253 RepID=A0A2I9DA82_9DEIO|nr:tyrosine-type recombinase/integrase [Deinococcus aerius]GBF07530.1 integrase family protein [Deinococcus aerius]
MQHRGKSHKQTPPPVPSRVITRRAPRSTEVQSVIAQHQAHCKFERLSERTTRFYLDACRSLEGYMQGAGCPPDLNEFQPDDLRGYMSYLRECGLSEGSVLAHLRGIRAMWGWAVKDDLLRETPFSRVRLPKNPKRIMPALQPGQFEQLLSAAKAHPRYPLRNLALLTTMFDTGVRVSELVGLELEHIDWDGGQLRVLGKGNKERRVPAGKGALRSLHRYVHRERMPSRETETRVFLNKFREPLAVTGVQQELEYLAGKAGMTRADCTPHTFRRGFAVQYLRNGGDVFQLQQILGHESLEMTRRYVRYLDEDLKNAHTRNSPVDLLGKAK